MVGISRMHTHFSKLVHVRAELQSLSSSLSQCHGSVLATIFMYKVHMNVHYELQNQQPAQHC